MIDPALRARVQAWRDDDPDAETAAELDRFLAAGDEPALRDRFDRHLGFGTAGLRGALGAGPNRMNRGVVRRAAAAIARWLDEEGVDGPVVVGRDARHRSAEFATDSAVVLAAAGREVVMAADPVPTPLLAFSVQALGAAAGIMVTASHNPPTDNGYKVFDRSGVQIVPPADRSIAAAMAAVEHASAIPIAEPGDRLISVLSPSVLDRYLDGVAGLRVTDLDLARLRVAYTPMHGVGRAALVAAFERCGLSPPTVVDEQAEPDPDFPTLPFPNPEEPGALDLVIELATSIGADLAIAHDPDADRLAAVVPTPGGWRVLTGDELGVLLADHLLRHTHGADRLVATTVVSSSMLSKLAAAHGAHFVETLTGFKWLARATDERPGTRLLFAYEEALGYSVGDLVRDKDGISAAVLVAELVAQLEAEGSSVTSRLDELTREHGLHVTGQRSLRDEGIGGQERMAEAVARLRAEPPASLGGVMVEQIEDLALGERLPATDALILRADGIRVVVRPSGTEPKLKVYAEVVASVRGDVDEARASGRALLGSVLDEIESLLR